MASTTGSRDQTQVVSLTASVPSLWAISLAPSEGSGGLLFKGFLFFLSLFFPCQEQQMLLLPTPLFVPHNFFWKRSIEGWRARLMG